MAWTSQTVMAAIKALACPQGCVKHADIVAHTQLTGRQVASACALLEKHGYLARQKYSDDSVKPGCYTLTALGQGALDGAQLTSGPKGPTGKSRARVDSLRDRAWRLLRIRRKGSAPELVGSLLDAGSDAAAFQRAQNNLHKYLRELLRAGYLAEMRREAPKSPTSNGAKRYLLARDTGPLPPIPQPLIKRVYDQNEKKHYATEQQSN